MVTQHTIRQDCTIPMYRIEAKSPWKLGVQRIASIVKRLLRHSVYVTSPINLLKPTGYVMHQQFNIQQL